MYGLSPVKDFRRAFRAMLTNQIAKYAPALYIRLTHETGRGGGAESIEEIAAYFETCFADYFKMLDISSEKIPEWLAGKTVLEYGPGDVPAVALLTIAFGAERVICADRFELVSLSDKNVAVLRCLMDRLPAPARARAYACFREAGKPETGFEEGRISYVVHPSGLSGIRDCADLIISRAVLEHVNDLSATFSDLAAALRTGGIAVQLVDLRSHGLHRSNPLDFLTWPSWIWSLMYSAKGVPNRWRVDSYRRYVEEQALEVLRLTPTTVADSSDIAAVRRYLANPFRELSDEDLSWLGFWLVCRKRDGQSIPNSS